MKKVRYIFRRFRVRPKNSRLAPPHLQPNSLTSPGIFPSRFLGGSIKGFASPLSTVRIRWTLTWSLHVAKTKADHWSQLWRQTVRYPPSR